MGGPRRVYDYRHLAWDKGPDVWAWVLVGVELGRGPDNEPLVACREPLVACREPVAWVAEEVVEEEAERLEASTDPGEWGSCAARRDVT